MLNFRKQLDRDLKIFLNDKKSLFDDPIHCVSRELAPHDCELISFIVAGLSYGRVEQIKKSSTDLLFRLSKLGLGVDGAGLAQYLKTTPQELLAQQLSEVLEGWKHRLNTSADLLLLFVRLKNILTRHKSLCEFFQQTLNTRNPSDSLIQFSDSFNDKAVPKRTRSQNSLRWHGTGLSWFAPSPSDGGTCKRLLMWLRWMVRVDQFDLGVWQNPSMRDLALPTLKSCDLFVPVDTHLQKWALSKKITALKSPNWKMTLQVTDFFKEVNKEDPLKYDFMICHQGMKNFRG